MGIVDIDDSVWSSRGGQRLEKVKETLGSTLEGFIIKAATIDWSRNVTEAARSMRDHSHGSIVVTKDSVPIGILTERDVLYKVVSEGLDPKKVKAGDVMTKPLVTIEVSSRVEEAIALMVRKNIRRLVVKKGDNFLGIVSMREVLGEMGEGATPIAELELPTGVRCPYCGSVFPDKHALSKHLDRIHIGSGLLEGDLRQW